MKLTKKVIKVKRHYIGVKDSDVIGVRWVQVTLTMDVGIRCTVRDDRCSYWSRWYGVRLLHYKICNASQQVLTRLLEEGSKKDTFCQTY